MNTGRHAVNAFRLHKVLRRRLNLTPSPNQRLMSQDGAPGDNMDQSAREAEPQVPHDVSDGQRRCGLALPATTDLVGRPLVHRNQHVLSCGHLPLESDR